MFERCAAWDGEAAGQLGCTTGLWIAEGAVWDQAETVDVAIDGPVPPAALRRCREPVLAACHTLAGFVRLAFPRNGANGLRLTVFLREGQDLASLSMVMQGYGMTLRSVRSDGADRRLLWPQQSSAAAGVPAGLTEQLQLRIAVEAGAPPRVLKELAAALGADTTASAPTNDGGRALVVQQLYDGAALLSGTTVARDGL